MKHVFSLIALFFGLAVILAIVGVIFSIAISSAPIVGIIFYVLAAVCLITVISLIIVGVIKSNKK